MGKRIETEFGCKTWGSEVMRAVAAAEPGDVIVVHDKSHVYLAEKLLGFANKTGVTVEMTDKRAKLFLTGELKHRDPHEVAAALYKALMGQAEPRKPQTADDTAAPSSDQADLE